MEQGNLHLNRRDGDLPDEYILRCRDLKHALKLCVEVSGIPFKDVAFQMDLPEKSISRMLADNPDDHRHFPPELINPLMNICHNEIPLRWQALTRNYGLHRLKSALELENERLKAVVHEQAKEMSIIKNFLKEVKL